MRPLWLSTALLLTAWPAPAGVLDNVGYTRLRTELGAAVPAGRGLRVTQVESPLETDHDGNPLTAKVGTYRPDVTARGLESQRIVVHGLPQYGAVSGHATAVARWLIGTRPQQGMARASVLEVRSVTDWLGQAGLRVFGADAPLASTSRVFNHSWAATLGGSDARVLRRVDWLADRDEVMHVVGVRNAPDSVNQPLLAAAFNVIVVGRSDGQHSRGTPRVDDTYVAGRARPHIVVPLKTASAATPVVASAALVLAEAGNSPGLSTSGAVTLTRGGLELRDGSRPEVLRAVLMASADRRAKNRNYADIDDYGATAAVRTANGLDRRYGAGQLNVYKAWHLLSAGEQEAGDRVATTGYDYASGLPGGDAGRGATASYLLETDEPGTFSASLSWHLSFPGRAGNRFDASAVLDDFDLCLYRVHGDGERLAGASASSDDTTENLYLTLPPGQYRLEVRRDAAGDRAADTRRDYGLAWQFVAAGAN